ncbi:MAG TPA: alpha-amylase family glycosyl hydrolase [Acidobacteriaceae bacterium]|nr:alpha-amylase family glycosyl hydrolase [Acidobacteriaceae bacterium]
MHKLTWWQRGVIYEVYPRSFQDSNGDGVGDLAGIRQRLDYLVNLGVNSLWLSPIYPSPMADFGYDIADYCDIDPIFGTLGEFDALLEEAHGRGLKIILDFVPNHTSDQHPWFLESRSSRTNPKRDWYLWRDEPNNWLSNFGGSGWEYDETTGQYYYHSFLKQQPDLNWRNPAVRTAMFEVLRFWLERGVDGFRVDVMWLMIKDDEFRDNPPNPTYLPGAPSSHRLLPLYNANRTEVHELVAAMRALVDSYPDRVLIGEIYLPIQQLMTYYGNDLTGVNLPFNFQLLQCAWSAQAIAQILRDYNEALPAGAWPNWVLGNHDQPRIASRIGAQQARIAAMLLFTLSGTLTMYYGEEICMTNVPIAPEDVQDPAEKNEPGIGAGRDPERTPMQWDSTPLAGFTTGHPWLPIAGDHAATNVATQNHDATSMLSLYRELISFRAAQPALIDGELQSVAAHDNILSYRRVGESETLLILLNLGHEAVEVGASGTILKSTHGDREGQHLAESTTLRPAEGLILET